MFVKKFFSEKIKAQVLNIIKKFSVLVVAATKVLLDFVGRVFKVSSKKAVGVAIAAAVVFLSLTATSIGYALEYVSAVAVVVNGRRLGYVVDSDAAQSVEQGIRTFIYGDSSKIVEVSFEETLAFGTISNPEDIIDVALYEVSGLHKVYGLFVDGIITAYDSNSNNIEDMLKTLVETYTTEGAQFVGYANSVEVKEIFITNSTKKGLATSLQDYLEGKTGVQIITTRVENYDEEVPFTTDFVYDVARKPGYNKVITKGKNGLNNVTADVTYVNGQRTKVDVITCEVITEPVTAKVKKGLSQDALDAIRQKYESNKENEVELMLFPCEITNRTYVSSFWGDGRNHKGVDIASPKGSNIYAAADGVVSFVGTYGAYGKCIIINHPDGKTQTLYSHNTTNLVKKGETVTAGQIIATVGETGNATGNHLHFSVLVKGKHVNPEKYLGIR